MVVMQAHKATTKNPSEKYNQFGRCLPDLYSQRLAQNSMLIFAKIHFEQCWREKFSSVSNNVTVKEMLHLK